MAAGVPVVVTKVGGLEEIVEDEETGLIAGPGDPMDLAAKIRMLLNDAGLRDRLSSKARETVAQEFSKESVIARLEQAYHDALRYHCNRDPTAARGASAVGHHVDRRRF